MDYKQFRNGFLSTTVLLAIFSITFLISSILLKPYIALEPADRDIIVILSGIDILFCIYWLIEGLYLKKVFKLEDKNVIKFGKRIAIGTVLYLPNFILFCFLFLKELHNLLIMMLLLLLVIKAFLLGIIFKEVYDLVFQNSQDRKFELTQNRKLYFDI
ncbi:MAG: hypothetical protein EU531_03095 [Promethearchaeota archaeon]|nr:MAG: hypothetical protein EU531_03095 [Candidatus Lokiarchaeota archaeon]